jgi:predicted nucleic acid-binding protein
MVIDASVAFKWLVEEDDSSMAIALLSQDALSAPQLILAEVGNALWKRIVRGEMGDSEGAVADIGRLPEMVALMNDSALAPRALELACELGHAIYDCFYLAAAEHQGDVLVTADRRLLRKTAGTQYARFVRDLSDC